VIFDTDDWVFDLGAAPFVAALEDMSPSERALYRQGLVRYRETASRCDAMLVSTEPLAELAKGLLAGELHVVANIVSQEMMQLAIAASARSSFHRLPKTQSPELTLGYFSGTPTHKRDFEEAADSVEWAMDTYSEVHLLTVGHIDVSERFGRFGGRFEHIPLQPWQRLSDIMTRVDVNLAPLERDNPFTASKSCLKFLEAAMVGVPTIATPVSDYRRVIEHGKNGVLADTPAEWRNGLSQLIESRELREEMGARARDDLIQRYTAQAHAPRFLEVLRRVAQGRGAERPLTINWILRAPIAGTGGGYWTIFRLANHLAAAGHRVRVYVEPIAHLAGRSREQIERFLEENFGPLRVDVFVGHDNILPADASIATNWPTAYTVAQQATSLFRIYFVQDFEPEFYAERDPWHRKAERTYSLPLKHVCIGRSLAKRISRLTGRPAECIDFAVDTGIFSMKRPPNERAKPLKVLFFARPSLKRRGYALGVEALEIFARRRPDARILFFGAHDREVRGVRFAFTNLGVLSHEELASAMNDAHIVLSFSLSANVSWVPLQAMACGAAVVEADVPGVREMVDDGETCLLVEPTAERVAQALDRLAAEDRARCRLASNAAAAFADRTWESSAHQFERILLRHCFARLPGQGEEAELAAPEPVAESRPVAALSRSAVASS
jgi:glycosyltransferase involved in cell wall biosynthesis